MSKTKSKRIFYFDALRALAILSVIFIHCFNTVIKGDVSFYSVHPSLSWVAAVFCGNYSRIGVDLFLMLSGALSLGREWEIRTFLGKRIPRIVLPFLFWGFVLAVGMIIFNQYYPIFDPLTKFDLPSFAKYLSNCYFAKNSALTPYWFFWMILGTYLIMPIFNKWLLHADLKEAEYFLIIWAITCLFQNTFNIKCPIKLDYFAGAIGMVVLGYYLRHTERKIFKNPYFIVSLLVISFTLIFFNTFEFSLSGTFHKLNRYNLFIGIEVMGVFLLFRYLSEHDLRIHLSKESIIRKGAASLAKYSYGLYLIHRPVIILTYSLLGITTKVYSVIAIIFVITTLITWLVMASLNRIPYVNQVIGAK